MALKIRSQDKPANLISNAKATPVTEFVRAEDNKKDVLAMMTVTQDFSAIQRTPNASFKNKKLRHAQLFLSAKTI